MFQGFNLLLLHIGLVQILHTAYMLWALILILKHLSCSPIILDCVDSRKPVQYLYIVVINTRVSSGIAFTTASNAMLGQHLRAGQGREPALRVESYKRLLFSLSSLLEKGPTNAKYYIINNHCKN